MNSDENDAKKHIYEFKKKYIKKWIPTKKPRQPYIWISKKYVKKINSDEKTRKKKELKELKELTNLTYKLLIKLLT